MSRRLEESASIAYSMDGI